MKIIVGLGNPGIRYEWTRHNVGFQVVDRLARLKNIPLDQRRFKILCGKGTIDSTPVILAKPLTFMNLSGPSVEKLVHFWGAQKEDLIVVHDDLDLPVGRLRIKRRGGDGGHQGLRSIIESLGEQSFLRLKIGIGRPPRGMEAADYVLAPLDEEERRQFDEIFSRAAESLVVMILEGVEVAMSRFQGNPILLSQSP